MAKEISTEATRVTHAEGREPEPRPARSADRLSGFDAPAARRFWKS